MTESNRPESNYPDHPLPPPIPVSANAATDRHKYDELIAVFVALLGIGSILFWGWSQKVAPFNLSADAAKSGLGQSGLGNGDAKIAAKAPEATLPAADGSLSVTKAAAPAASPAASPAPGNGLGPVAAAGTVAATVGAASAAKADPAPAPSVAPIPAPSPTASAAASVAPSATPNPLLTNPGKPQLFKDVPTDAVIAPYVAELSSRGVITGSNGMFRPDEPITRGQFAAMVSKGFNKPKSLPVKKFEDITAGTPAAIAVDEAIQTGFMKGYSDKEFKPEQQIPRYQLQVALATGMGLTAKGEPATSLAKFDDAKDMPKWANSQVAAALDAGILAADNKLVPVQTATRGDAAAMIYQALVKEGVIKPAAVK
jgi:S-layer homology domain